jgi:hypothetical protein
MISNFILLISCLISVRISCLRDSRSAGPLLVPADDDEVVSWPVSEGWRLSTKTIHAYIKVFNFLELNQHNYMKAKINFLQGIFQLWE